MQKIRKSGILLIIWSLLFVCSNLHAEEAAAKENKKLRIVSLAPSITEIIYHLGKGDSLIGRSSACNYPEEAKKVEVTGKFGDPSIEKLLILKPDIVITCALKDPSLEKAVKRLGIKFLYMPNKSIDDYLKTIETLGKELDCKKKADTEIKRIKKGLEELKKEADKLPANKRPKVYFEVWDKPIMTIGNKSFLNDYIKYAGGRNITESQDRSYFSCSEEFIIVSNPDVIICPAMKKGNITKVLGRPGWDKISAVKNKRIYVELNEDVIFRPGPRMLEGISLLRECIFPAEGKKKDR